MAPNPGGPHQVRAADRAGCLVASVAPYRVAPALASPAQWARAPRYSTLGGAWDAIGRGDTVRDANGALVAFHESALPFVE